MYGTTDWIKVIDLTIAENFLVVFSFYTILLAIVRFVKRTPEAFEAFDQVAVKLTRWVTVAWLILKFISMILFWYQLSQEEEGAVLRQHMMWWLENAWFQWVIWSCLPFLLWWKRTKTNVFARIVFGLAIAFSFELIIIIITSLYRDYLSNSWRDHVDLKGTLIWLPVRLVGFILMVGLIARISRRKKVIRNEESQAPL